MVWEFLTTSIKPTQSPMDRQPYGSILGEEGQETQREAEIIRPAATDLLSDLRWLEGVATNLHSGMSAEHESIRRPVMCTCILAVMVKWGAYLRSRPWFCQMFSIILMICSVSMSCLRSAEAHRDKKVNDSEVIISCLAALWSASTMHYGAGLSESVWSQMLQQNARAAAVKCDSNNVTCSCWDPCKVHWWGCVCVPWYALQAESEICCMLSKSIFSCVCVCVFFLFLFFYTKQYISFIIFKLRTVLCWWTHTAF